MDDLVTWLRAQLDEDERVAQAATTSPWTAWHAAMGNGQIPVAVADQRAGEAPVILCESRPDAEHIARHDPAQVLRDVEAKRRILDWLDQVEHIVDLVEVYSIDADDARELLALPYADRPGYRDEWRPS